MSRKTKKGGWIPFQKKTLTKPEILEVAHQVGVHSDHVLANLIRLWCWIDEHRIGEIYNTTNVAFLEDIFRDPIRQKTDIMVDALINVGWLRLGSNFVEFVNINDWLSTKAKKRLSDARNKAESRQNEDKSRSEFRQNTDNNSTKTKTENYRGMNSPITPSCSELENPASEPVESEPEDPVILTFPIVGDQGYWNLKESKVKEWTESFPHLDVMLELKKARQWCLDNPANRKTSRGMTRFLGGWLSRAQNSGGRKQTSGSDPIEDRISRIERESQS